MDVTRRNHFFIKYRDYILFNKNLLISGTSAVFTAALIAQVYALYDRSALANSIIGLVTEYGVYIPLFALLFYRDNKDKYVDPVTGKKNSKKIKEDVKKLFAAFSVSEVIYSITRTTIHYETMLGGLEPYQASMVGSLIAWAVFFGCINLGVKLVRLFKKTA